MRVGSGREAGTLAEVPAAARRAEDLGYDFFSSSETQHNPFLSVTLAAEHTERVELRTSIALAFARSPMDTAYTAWDLQAQSDGRFVLGLGSQVRGHIVRRFNMPWSPPARRMREYVLALRAIWDCFQNGTRLNYQSESYNFNLMPPNFNPGPIEHPNVKVCLAAVNTYMMRVAGEVADGVFLHGFNTPKHTREVILPNIRRGLEKAGRTMDELDISGGGFVITGATEEEISANTERARSQIAFYASTRAYAPVMNTHGWNDTAQKLYRMSVDNRWGEMGAEITDEMLGEFAVVGHYDSIVDQIKERFGEFDTSFSFSIPVRSPEDEERLRWMIKSLQED